MQQFHKVISGLGFTASSVRSIQSGAAYDGLFGAPTNVTKTLQTNPSITDTMRHMAVMIVKYKQQTRKLYDYLRKKASTDEDFLRKLWEFQYNHIQYKEDERGKEQLRQPNAAWRDRKSGIDCDCFSIFTATTLMHDKKLHPVIRVIKQPGMPTFHHVYIVVPKTPNADISKRENYWVIDPVVDKFDYEVKFSEKIDLAMADFVIQELGSVSNLGCANKKCNCSLGCANGECKCKEQTKHIIISSTDMYNRLRLERELIASGKVTGLDKQIDLKQLVSGIDDILLNWNDEPKRLALLRKYRSQFASAMQLNGLGATIDLKTIVDPNTIQAGAKAAANFLPGGGFISSGLDLFFNNAGSSNNSGFSSKQGSAQTIWFWKYFPGQPRYKQPVIYESDSQSYREREWRPTLEKESGGIPLEQMEKAFEAAMQIEPGLVDKKFPTSIELWKYIISVSNRAQSSTNTNSLSLSNPIVKWGGIALLATIAVGTAIYITNKD